MPTLLHNLALLEMRGLVRMTSERDKPLVRFKHALTREATYNSMLQTRRAELHRAAAQTLANFHTQPDLEMVLTIAEHWQRGNEDARALETILPHAQNLIYTGRSISLTLLLSRLERENLNETQQRDLDIALADAHAARGEYEPARALYERALAFVKTIVLRASTLHRIGIAHYNLGSYTRAVEYHERALELARQTDDLALQAQTLGGLGMATMGGGEAELAQTYLQESRLVAVQSGNLLEIANAESNLAILLARRAEFPQAIQFAEHVLELDEQLGHTFLAARTFQLLGGCYYGIGDYVQAENYYLRAMKVSRESGDVLGMAVGMSNLAELYSERGELERAAQFYQQAIPHLQMLKHDYSLAFAFTGLAQVQVQQAQPLPEATHTALVEAALTNAKRALTIAREIQSREREGTAQRVLAEIYYLQKNIQAAQDAAARAVELLDESAPVYERRRAQETFANLFASSAHAENPAAAEDSLSMAQGA